MKIDRSTVFVCAASLIWPKHRRRSLETHYVFLTLGQEWGKNVNALPAFYKLQCHLADAFAQRDAQLRVSTSQAKI